jgi:hypothetical protein
MSNISPLSSQETISEIARLIYDIYKEQSYNANIVDEEVGEDEASKQ